MVIGPLPPPLNGMTVMTAYVLEALRASNWRVIHLDLSDHRKVGNVGRLDLRNVVLGFRHWWDMLRLVTREHPRLIYLPIAQGTLGMLRDSMFFIGARLIRTSCVVHLHGSEFNEFYRSAGPLVRFIVRESLKGCCRGIVLSESLQGSFGSLIQPDRIRVVSNGIPDRPPLRGRLQPRECPTVLFLSNLSERKGYRDVLRAAEVVCSAQPSAHFVIAGDWPSRKEEIWSRATVQEMGLERRIRFVGAVSGVRKCELLASTDVFVFPPRQPEGQSLVLLEAMSYGLPIVTTRLGGIRDIIVTEETGLIVEPGCPVDVAAAVVRLIDSPSLRRRLGENARRRYECHYTSQIFGTALTRVLQDAIDHAGDGEGVRLAVGSSQCVV